jgi:hypothetical protein
LYVHMYVSNAIILHKIIFCLFIVMLVHMYRVHVTRCVPCHVTVTVTLANLQS